MAQPLWTTIIRTNGTRDKTLTEAIRSVAVQTYQPVSIVLVISNTHKTYEKKAAATAEKLSSEIPIDICFADPRKKRGHPINVGLDHCRAEYVSILDDDDIFYPHMGRTLIKELEKGTCNFAYGNTTISRRTAMSDGFAEISSQTHGYGEPFNPVRLVAQNYVHMSSVIFKFSDFRSIRTSEQLELWEDWYLLLGMLFSGNIKAKHVDREVSEYRIVGTENSNSFHRFPKKELLRNYTIIKNAFIKEKLTIAFDDVFRIYPELPTITDTPNQSDIQKLLDQQHYADDLLNRRFIRSYLKLCSLLHKLPEKP